MARKTTRKIVLPAQAILLGLTIYGCPILFEGRAILGTAVVVDLSVECF